MLNNRKGILPLDIIGKILLALFLLLVFVGFAYIISGGTLSGIGEYIKNLFRFGRA